MRATSIIYRRELLGYLRSPISWAIAAVLLLAQGIFFQAWALRGEQLSAVVLERYFFIASFVIGAAGIIFSFRLIAEERQNHSMVLLTTSPVRDFEIALGKFFAALTFLTITLVLSIYMPILIKVNGKITGAQIFVGYLGLFLFGSVSLAIGMFASALTRHQFLALVIGAVLLIVLGNIFQLASKLDAPVRPVVEQLDLWWVRFQSSFMKGIFNLKDVIFYVCVTYFFLLLAVKTLEAKRWQ
ncbi:MAG: ABC transporter permease subunit [Kofleriaceae bacterium]|nr:ABC transporter permease subunit [Kofleriaceae bacterium]